MGRRIEELGSRLRAGEARAEDWLELADLCRRADHLPPWMDPDRHLPELLEQLRAHPEDGRVRCSQHQAQQHQPEDQLAP